MSERFASALSIEEIEKRIARLSETKEVKELYALKDELQLRKKELVERIVNEMVVEGKVEIG